jgi:hypothetical protein
VPRIEDLATQDEIANSLLGDEAEQQAPEQPVSEYAVSGKDLLDEEIAERGENVFRDGDEGAEANRQERLRSERPETGANQAHQGRQQPQPQQEAQDQQQAPEPTIEQVQAGIEALDAAVQEHGLNDPQSAREFATDFCSAFGTDVFKSGVDVETLGSTMAKATLSAVNLYTQSGGDLAQMGEVPEAAARAFTHDVLKGLGFDPRSVQVDERLLANTVLSGTLSFLDTYSKLGGKVTDMSRLNSPEAAEWLLGNWLRAFGIDRPVDRATALRFADAGGKYILSFLGKLGQVQDRQAATQDRQPRGGRGRGQRVPAGMREGIRGSRAARFKTNAGPNDPFNAQVMADYEQRNARL